MCVGICCAALLFASGALLAEGEKSSPVKAVEFLTGFGWGKLRSQHNYHLYPFMVDFDFDLKPLTQKIHFNPPSLIQFQIEPYLSYIASPHSDIETGTVFFLKVGLLPETSKFQPYVKAGAGLCFMTLHTREQGTQFNFNEPGGIGFHYFFTKDCALTVEGRYRHLSNAGTGSPNSGVNTAFIVTGVTRRF